MLELKGVCKTFLKGTVNEHVALDHVDLALQKGEFITVIGSNGAGKSSLFNAISGVFYADEGKVLLEGRDVTYMPEYKRAAVIGRLFQDPQRGTAPDMTIEENLALAFRRKSGNPLRLGIRRCDTELFKQRLEGFGMGLENRLKTKVGLLSGGQRQALSLLMSTIAKPRLLLLDEHTAALDPASAEQVMHITQEIVKRESLTTLMVTHNIALSLKTGTRTIMLDRGRVVLDLNFEERQQMTVPALIELFQKASRQTLNCDRMLLS